MPVCKELNERMLNSYYRSIELNGIDHDAMQTYGGLEKTG